MITYSRTFEDPMPIEPFRPTAFQSALLLLRLHELRDEEKKNKTKTKDTEEKKAKDTEEKKAKDTEEKKVQVTRFRVSELTLKRICGRPRLHAEFLTEMQDWLLRAGWAFFFADRSYGMIKLEAVETWTRLGSKRIADKLDDVAKGDFDFAPLVHLAEPNSSVQDD
jgi:hypothetical protein